jgi:hypothetical protein
MKVAQVQLRKRVRVLVVHQAALVHQAVLVHQLAQQLDQIHQFQYLQHVIHV